ncbi:hypothetical protein CCP3SC15_1280002 [Gammaproteobacteria bacterium]
MNPLAQGAPASTSSLVSVIGGQAKTTSLIVAEKFRKRHDTVLRAIKNLDCSPEFTHRNFAASEYTDSTGRKLPAFEMTRDGFTFLVTGFTGKEAAQWKEAYIDAFNKMEAALIQRQALPANARFLLSFSGGKGSIEPIAADSHILSQSTLDVITARTEEEILTSIADPGFDIHHVLAILQAATARVTGTAGVVRGAK